MIIPVSRPTLRRKDLNSVLSCLVSDRIAPGPLNQELISSLSRFLTVAGGLTLSSYQSGIHCALEALELTRGDGVVLSALAPRDYLQVLVSRGLEPRICDVEAQAPYLKTDDVERHLSTGAKAVVCHYTLGFVAPSDDLFQLGVPVIEDISQALGGSWNGEYCGSRGQAGIVSLDPGGIITAGCGCMVFSRDRRLLRALKSAAQRSFADQQLPDMNAALGITQVREIQGFLSKRREMASLFREALQRSRHSAVLADTDQSSVDFTFPVIINDSLAEVRQYAAKKDIETRMAFKDAIVAMAGAAGGEGEQTILNAEFDGTTLANAKQFAWRCLLFPLYPGLARKDIQLICKVLTTLP